MEKTVDFDIKNLPQNFLWVKDFSLPTTDSSERALRGVKSKMKISGQFYSEQTADNYAVIKSYIETCRRNRINEMQALQRLADGNPYTVQEIFYTWIINEVFFRGEERPILDYSKSVFTDLCGCEL